MGLDMYLTKEIYVGSYFSHREIKGIISLTSNGESIPINIDKIELIIERIGYWRKANAIHNWFVENVQKGKDDCGKYYVELDQLKSLLKLCQKVKKTHYLASKLLPVKTGFFFGSQDYNEYYFEDIDNTISILKSAIKEKNEFSNIYYQSSW